MKMLTKGVVVLVCTRTAINTTNNMKLCFVSMYTSYVSQNCSHRCSSKTITNEANVAWFCPCSHSIYYPFAHAHKEKITLAVTICSDCHLLPLTLFVLLSSVPVFVLNMRSDLISYCPVSHLERNNIIHIPDDCDESDFDYL